MNRLDRLLDESVRRGAFTCATYSIGTRTEEIASGSVGTLGNGRGGAGMETLFDLASVTKPIVAVAFMKLFEAGHICLDDTVDRFLPSFRRHPKGRISMLALLTHTSTIHGQVQLYRTCRTKEEMLLGIQYMPPRDLTIPSVEYSSQGFIILGEIVAAITGAPLDAAMQSLVFDPLEMRGTLYCPKGPLLDRVASTENCPWRGCVVTGEVHDENAVVMGGVCGHAGLFAPAEDIAKLCRAMLSGKAPGGARYLMPATIVLMTRNHTQGLNLARGLGWQGKDPCGSPAGDLFSPISYGHTGFTGTSLWMDPTRDLYAVLLTNRVHPSRDSDEIIHVRHTFHNLAALWADERADRERNGDSTCQTLRTD